MENILKALDITSKIDFTNPAQVFIICAGIACLMATFISATRKITAIDLLFMDKAGVIQNNAFYILTFFMLFSAENYLMTTDDGYIVLLIVLFLLAFIVWLILEKVIKKVVKKGNYNKIIYDRKDILELSMIILLFAIMTNVFCRYILGNVNNLQISNKLFSSSLSCIFILSLIEAIIIFGAYCNVNSYRYKFKYKEKVVYIIKSVGKYVLCSTEGGDSDSRIYISIEELVGKELIKIDDNLEKNNDKTDKDKEK